ncbi:hypothetical protein OH460_09115 [Vibrio sp. Makdt]|uniref:hypothetical protein n=1 Tax=Vibrio sp. Makdt TaxID=2998828 RepID=UPI0022CDA822|nr:hypothetical protein [Vibrio sp. Makdt]MDA0152462.1 hypothetical protein [Vibrio sp. Makdt]
MDSSASFFSIQDTFEIAENSRKDTAEQEALVQLLLDEDETNLDVDAELMCITCCSVHTASDLMMKQVVTDIDECVCTCGCSTLLKMG